MVASEQGDDLARAMRCTRAVERAEASGRVALEATALRSRSLEALDVALALATSGRECDYPAWSQRVTTATRGGRGIRDELDPQWAASLAQILTRLILEPAAEAIALDIYRELAARFGPESFEPRDAQVYGQLLLHSEEHEVLRAALPHLDLRPVIRRMLLTDLQREDVTRGLSPLADWTLRLQELMQGGSPGFELPDDTDPFSFDRLSSRTGTRPVDGPLITVVMPVFAPDAGLGTAVRSILNQTWQNLELLIVDDASPEPTRYLFEEVAALDERVRVITRPRNGGTYAARNTALALARGSFIAGQDADDWSHPERLQRQVEPLLEDRSLVATLSRCLRVTDDLRSSSLRASGSSPMRMNSSSLLFRRSEVMHQMGYYDKVRKSGDSEFIFRMRAVFGELAVPELPECLALVRLTSGSLSRADFLPGWQHEARVWYRELFRNWHRRIRGGEDPFLAIDQRERPFAAPAGVVSRSASVLEVDDLFVADLRKSPSSHERLLCVVRQLSKQGRRVGLAHLERFDTLQPVRHGLAPAILDGLSEGEFELVEWSRRVNAEQLVCWPAELPEFHGERESQWRVGRVNLVVEQQVPVSQVRTSFLRWQTCASSVARNTRVEGRIGLVTTEACDPGFVRFATEEDRAFHQVGLLGPPFDRLEAVLVQTWGATAPSPRLAEHVDTLAKQGIPLRTASRNAAGAIVSSSHVIEVNGTRVEPWEADATSVVFGAVDDVGGTTASEPPSASEPGPRSEDGLRLVPVPQPDAAFSTLSRSQAISLPRASSSQHHRVACPATAASALPFVAVAGALGVEGVRGWSNRRVASVEYWFPADGDILIAPTADGHRLRVTSCVVAVHPRSGGVADAVDVWSGWSRSGIEDPAGALETLGTPRAPAALAVHDSHRWTVHSTAPTELICRSDPQGCPLAVATDEATLASFLSALHDAAGFQGGSVGNSGRAGQLLSGGSHRVRPAWVRDRAAAFSALGGRAFIPVAELASSGRPVRRGG